MPIAYVCDRCDAEATVTLFLSDGTAAGHRCEDCFDALKAQCDDVAYALSPGGDGLVQKPNWGPQRGQA